MNLVIKLVIPFVISIILIIVSVIGMLYFLEEKHQDFFSIKEFKSVNLTLDKLIKCDTKLAEDLLHLISKDPKLKQLFKSRDRERTFLNYYQTFLKYKENYGFSHFYLHDVNQTNFLRLHNKGYHSDHIDRKTLKRSIATASSASGIEFGIYNNLTLRVVIPWFDNETQIGYLELGKDFDYYLDELSNKSDTEFVMMLRNSFIDNEKYLKWKEISSNKHMFKKLKNFSVVNSTVDLKDKKFLEVLDQDKEFVNREVLTGKDHFHIQSKVIKDIDGKDVGKLYIMYNHFSSMQYILYISLQIFLFLLFVSSLVFIYYFNHIKKIDNKLQKSTKKIEFNLLFEKFVNDVSTTLLEHKNFDNSVDNVLEKLAKTLNVDRAYIFRFHNNFTNMSNTNEWCADGIVCQKENLQNIPTTNLEWWLEQCMENKPIVLNTLDDLPIKAISEKNDLSEQNIKSLLVYHIYVDKKLYGYIGIDMVKKHVKWNDTYHSFLNVTAEVISNILSRKAKEQLLKESLYKVSLILDTAYNGILVVDKNHKTFLYNQRFLEIWDLEKVEEGITTLDDIFEYISSKLANFEKCKKDLESFYDNSELEKRYELELVDAKVVEIIVNPIYDGGEYIGNSISFIDITQRTLFINEMKLSAEVFNNSQEGIIITDSENKIIKVNKAFEELTGYSSKEVIGHNPTILKSKWHDEAFYKELWDTLHKEKIWEGEITDRRKDGELYITYSSIIMITDDNNNIKNYIGISRDITKSKEKEKHIKSLAFYDVLTGLPNRSLFNDRLNEVLHDSKRESQKVALLFLDLDGFKNVNDTHGHHIGDMLLKEVSNVFVKNVRENDTVSRLGGDEFTIILRHIESSEDVETVANKIIKSFSEPIIIDGISISIGCSIGASIYPDDSEDIKNLIKLSDEAMYDAKKSGKNRLRFVNS